MSLRFRGSWRSYQKRILDSLDFHLLDKKLHIVAAPGAGKTTLGIEVLSRLKQPALILCPTNTIKNQWKERICSSFLDECEYGLVSTNIREPKYITVITYQALLAAFTGAVETDEQAHSEEESEDEEVSTPGRFNAKKAQAIIEILKSANISVLCFDEAHHLRKEWWKALIYFVEELVPKQTVALTATPPYDVDYAEWERYEELCGPIDEAISIPELVKNGDLCPHQDFIYFSSLRKNEQDIVKDYNKKAQEFFNILQNDTSLIEYLAQMEIWDCSGYDVEKIFDNPELYVSIASLLKSKNIKVSKKFLELFDARESEIPKFNLNQAKIFLNGFLCSHSSEFVGLEKKIEAYLNLAKKSGLIQKKKLVLDESTKIQKQIANSLGKLDSIIEIINLEYSSLQSSLRMVVLADYIKADDTDNSHLGVVPIWRVVKNKFASKIPIGILSGSLIVLPLQAKDMFLNLLEQNSLDSDCVSITAYREDSNFIKITPKESAKHCIVSLVTEMFTKGAVNVLIGTQALLGEGWDAPCINSLILSSTVSSYMLSNQMRGRAIRKDKNNPDKISNIWHLATVSAPRNEFTLQTVSDTDIELQISNLYDIEQLTKRFEGFEAPAYFNEHEIMNGISRVLPSIFYEQLKKGDNYLSVLNGKTFALARDRQQTKKWWDDALYLGYGNGIMRLSSGVNTPDLTAKSLCYKGYKFLLYSLFYTFMLIFYYVIQLRSLTLLVAFLLVMLICFAVVGIRYLQTGSISGVMKQIVIVHLETLSYLGLIKSSIKNAGIYVDKQETVYVGCFNLPVEENNLLIKCLQEFLDPIENPRYILVKRGDIGTQVDYFAIPSVMCTNKNDVEVFEKLWNKYIGKAKVVYTRNYEGRKLLLKARKTAFSATQRKKTQKLSKWQGG